MRFIESTNFFVRTILFDFENRDAAIRLKFRLAPMIHIGSKQFYDTVLENIRDCDEILYEGVKLRSAKTHFLSRFSLKNLDLLFRQYKIVADKLGLVTQSEYFNLSELSDKLHHIDYNPVSRAAAWKSMRWGARIYLSLIKPLQFFVFHQGINRAILAKNFMTSAEEAYLAYGPIEDEPGTATNFVMNEREQIIFERIDQKMHQEADTDKTIGIIYGAGHMKSIARYLIDQLNFVPKNGRFMKVFDVR